MAVHGATSTNASGRPRAGRHNASSPEDIQDGAVAYERFPPSRPARYRDGLLPD